jgi:hypothetical protein
MPRENRSRTVETNIRDSDQEQNMDDFGSPHDQRTQKASNTGPLRAESSDITPSEQTNFRSGPEPAYGYPDRRAGTPTDERPTYEQWLQEHENEPRWTEAERQLEGLQDQPQEIRPQSQSRRGPMKVPLPRKAARAEARTRTSSQPAPQQRKPEGRKTKEKTSKGETKRRFEDNSEMSKL